MEEAKHQWALEEVCDLQFVAVCTVCSKTAPDRSLCQLKRTARSYRFDPFMLLVQDRSKPVSVPSQMNCPVRSFRAVRAACPISLFLTGRKREAGAGAGARGARGARGAGAGGPDDARPGRGVGANEEGAATAPRRVGCLAECEGLLPCSGVVVIISWANITLCNITL